MRIGILSAGGDCPGINATIRGVGKSAHAYFGMDVIGIKSGFSGLLENEYLTLDDDALSGLLSLGGTILGTSREKPFKGQPGIPNEKPHIIAENYRKLGLDCLVCIGGNGTQKTAYRLSQLGLNIIGIPKTIDNDIWGTDITFGFYTAVDIATEAIDRLHSTASSHKRVMIIELMGHKAGWITLFAGMAGGADVILLPELGYDIQQVNRAILNRVEKGKSYSIVAMCEGLDINDKRIEYETGIETRKTILGYVQRGGSPSAFDRNLATRLGGHATELIVNKQFNRMVCVSDDRISSVPLEEVAGKMRFVPPNHDLIVQGRRMGISFGVEYPTESVNP
jgi:6-phosphofructokinase 1